MQHARSLVSPTIATLCIIVGDSILRITSLGKLPTSSTEWVAVLARPEVLNVVVVGILIVVVSVYARTSAIVTAVILTLSTTATHRWMVGPVFKPVGMMVTAIMFFALSWVSLWIASVVTGEQEHRH